MFELRTILTRVITLTALLFSLTGQRTAYADDGGTSDPYFTVASIIYNFSTGDCDPFSGGAQPCANPLQASINFLNGTEAASPWFGIGTVPDDGNIYVEAGLFTEEVIIDGFSGWGSGANTPTSLGIVGAGSASTTLDGAFVITGMHAFTLSGFTIEDTDSSGNVTSITAYDNDGTFELSDIMVVNTEPGLIPIEHIGDGIHVFDHAGDIILTDVNSSNNSESGAWLVNTAGTGAVSITSSSFNDNGEGGLIVQSNGDISLASVFGNNNLSCNSAENCNDVDFTCVGTGNISVSSSTFNNNGEPDDIIPAVIGFVVMSGGDIHLSNVTANTNNNNGVLLLSYFNESTGDVLVESSEFNENGQGELGDGLIVRSRGEVRLIDITAELNLEDGIQVSNGFGGAIADIIVEGGQFNDNGLAGLQLGASGNINVSGSSLTGNSALWGTSSGIQAYTDLAGNITVSNVISDNNHGGGAELDNRAGTGTILVETSEFNQNDGCGLCAFSNGDISFIGVTADFNDGSGANAVNCNDVDFTCTGTGNILISSSSFSNNGPVGIPSPHWVGFVAYSNGDITLSNVRANSNNYHGAVIFNYFDESVGNIFVEASEFNNNGQGGELGDGLKPQSRADIELLDVIANGNLEKGVEAASGYSGGIGIVSVEGGEFNNNGVEGLELVSNQNNVSLSGASVHDNGLRGADLGSPTTVTVSCSTFMNHPLGILGTTPLLTLNGVSFTSNTVDYTNTGVVVINSDCNPASTTNGDLHGKGNPLNGSAHANCHASKGEVDPICRNR